MWRVVLCMTLIGGLFGCSEGAPDVPFEPPLLLERDTSTVLGSVDGPHALPFVASAQFGTAFVAYSFELVDPRLRVRLESGDSAAQHAIALYGPRSSTGVWGKAMATRSGPPPLLLDVSKLEPGRYLVLLAPASPSPYVLTVDCGDACTQLTPTCMGSTECTLSCANGFELDAHGCELCVCALQCLRDADCERGMVCREDGLCVASCQCSEPFAPVCGSNGQTFANACEARCANVEVLSDSPCPADCPPLECELSCAFGFSAGEDGCPSCGCNSACALCDRAFDAVCTANGKTYLNRCLAECEGEVVVQFGACRPQCKPLECAAPCASGFALDAQGCASCTCLEQEQCKELGAVCGAHGGSYANACAAQSDEVAIVYADACPSFMCSGQASCPLGTFCQKPAENESCVSSMLEGSSCLGVCVRQQDCSEGSESSCPVGYRCTNKFCESRCQCSTIYEPVCGADAQVYDNACTAACQGVAVAKLGFCCPPALACESSCPQGYALDANGCPSCVCRSYSPCACTELENPVCVSLPDGSRATYRNACWAQCDGHQHLAEGDCP